MNSFVQFELRKKTTTKNDNKLFCTKVYASYTLTKNTIFFRGFKRIKCYLCIIRKQHQVQGAQ